ncbi:hypothetical protein BD779DRAFT_952500 [Infundibulicybe gibba]|nr:hypothetical protein BD779DRAFT_952500 [Infundibulicybe gibba]
MQNGHKPGPRNRPTCPLPSQYGPRVPPPIDRDQHTQARQQFYDPRGENWSASVPVPPRPRTLSISSVNGTHQFPIRRTSHPELSSRKYTVSEHTTPNNCRTDTLDSRLHESYGDGYHSPRPVQVELLPSRRHPPPGEFSNDAHFDFIPYNIVSTWPLRPTRVQDPTNISYEQ